MYAFLSGIIAYKNPTYIILDVNGIGFHVNISLNTYTHIEKLDKVRIWTELIVREDSMTIYGFFQEEEKKLFNLLINVNGVGANTARLILSGMSVEDFQRAILQDDVAMLQRIKGIGKKTAQRLILDLKDKINKGDSVDLANITYGGGQNVFSEAQQALESLGFPASRIKKAIAGLKKEDTSGMKTEDVIKRALKLLS